MKKLFFISAVLLLSFTQAFSQKYFSRSIKVQFYSHTSVEDIKAENKSTTVVLDAKSGGIEFKVQIKGFLFENALMQEHFNENYMESSKYPSASFKGNIENLSSVNFGKDGTYNTTVKGNMTMHGVKKEISVPGTFTVGGGKIALHAQFNVSPQDYNIDIPGVVRDKIAQNIQVTVDGTLDFLGK